MSAKEKMLTCALRQSRWASGAGMDEKLGKKEWELGFWRGTREEERKDPSLGIVVGEGNRKKVAIRETLRVRERERFKKGFDGKIENISLFICKYLRILNLFFIFLL